MTSEIPTSFTAIRIPALGVNVTPMTDIQVVEWISRGDGKRLLLNHNLHSAYIFQKDSDFRKLYDRATRTIIDGAPILFLAKLHAKHLTSSYRIGSTDWIERLSESSEPGRLFVYGASLNSNARAVDLLRSALEKSGWAIAGINGYEEPAAVIKEMKEFRPTLVLVGLGMPLQEKFLECNWNELPQAVYATVGGAIDYVAGEAVLAPRWAGALGVEWLWRLTHDPVRLAGRYLVEPFKLLFAIIRKQRVRSGSD